MTLAKLSQLERDLKIAEELAETGSISHEQVVEATRHWLAARDEAMREKLITPLSDAELEHGF